MTMNAVLKGPDALVGDKSRALHAIWLKLTGDRLAPKREEFTLAHIRTLAPWVWSIDVIDGGKDFRFRLAGDRIIEFMQKRYVGAVLSELPRVPFFVRMQAILSHCVATQRPVAAGPFQSAYENKDHLEMEVVVLPLSDDGESVTALLGVMELWPLGTMTKPSCSAIIS